MKTFRRPLRMYLFEVLLVLTILTFLLQMGYVFIPIFRDISHTQQPTGGEKALETLDVAEGIVHVEERDANNGIDMKHRKDQIEHDAKKAAVKPDAPQKKARGDHKEHPPKPKKDNPSKVQKPVGDNAPNAKPKESKVNPPFAQNKEAKPQNADAKAKLQGPEDAKPKTDAKPKNDTKPKNDAKPKRKPRKKILVLGGMKIVEKWSELSTLVKYLKDHHPRSDGVTYRAAIECPGTYDIDFTFSSNYTAQMAGKDAVILNVAPYTLLNHLTKLLTQSHPEKQLWMLYGVETALRIHKWIRNIGSLEVHGVWSYLSDSEIHMPYAYYQPGPPVTDTVKRTNKFWIQSKTNLVAWMGSNCVKEVFWPRMEYIEELTKYLPVHTYGKCGNLSCLPRLSEHCKNLMNSYKFYLSFENAECDEYITEKMWDTALQHGVVPVVYGAHKADYERLAPPKSFIYAGDFKTPKALADYLLKLDRHPELYAKYFEWRYHGSVKQVYPDLKPDDFCKVLPFIDKLQKGELQKKLVSSFPWFNSCRNKIVKIFNPKDIPSLDNWEPWFSN